MCMTYPEGKSAGNRARRESETVRTISATCIHDLGDIDYMHWTRIGPHISDSDDRKAVQSHGKRPLRENGPDDRGRPLEVIACTKLTGFPCV